MEKEPLLQALKRLHPESSTTTLRSWVEEGRISIDGFLPEHINQPVLPSQTITLRPKVKHLDSGVLLLYEDDDLVVIDKPTKLLTVPPDHGFAPSVHAILKERRRGVVYPVHRLDKDTSGVLVFAYSERGRDGLKALFFDHTIEREYLGLVQGKLRPRTGTWKSFLTEDPSYFVQSNASDEGKLAITHYETLAERRNSSLVRFKLETGRKNQIRVHASEAGHPLLGDTKYGSESSPYGRLCLHAHKLAFAHPITGKNLSFISPAPAFFLAQ